MLFITKYEQPEDALKNALMHHDELPAKEESPDHEANVLGVSLNQHAAMTVEHRQLFFTRKTRGPNYSDSNNCSLHVLRVSVSDPPARVGASRLSESVVRHPIIDP